MKIDKNNTSIETIDTETLWNQILNFASYAFNKSHSVGYSQISYLTAKLMHYYPGYYLAALMKNADANKKKQIARTASHRGIKIDKGFKTYYNDERKTIYVAPKLNGNPPIPSDLHELAISDELTSLEKNKIIQAGVFDSITKNRDALQEFIKKTPDANFYPSFEDPTKEQRFKYFASDLRIYGTFIGNDYPLDYTMTEDDEYHKNSTLHDVFYPNPKDIKIKTDKLGRKTIKRQWFRNVHVVLTNIEAKGRMYKVTLEDQTESGEFYLRGLPKKILIQAIGQLVPRDFIVTMHCDFSISFVGDDITKNPDDYPNEDITIDNFKRYINVESLSIDRLSQSIIDHKEELIQQKKEALEKAKEKKALKINRPSIIQINNPNKHQGNAQNVGMNLFSLS